MSSTTFQNHLFGGSQSLGSIFLLQSIPTDRMFLLSYPPRIHLSVFVIVGLKDYSDPNIQPLAYLSASKWRRWVFWSFNIFWIL